MKKTISFEETTNWCSINMAEGFGTAAFWKGRGVASAPVAPPLPTSLASVNYFFTLEEFILTVASWVILVRWRDIERFLLEFKASYFFLNSYIW